MKCCIWELQGCNLIKQPLSQRSLIKGGAKKYTSFLIQSMSCDALVFTLICSNSKFTTWTLSLLLAHERIVYIAPWLIGTVSGSLFLDVQSKSFFINSRVEPWELCPVTACPNLSGNCFHWTVIVLFFWEWENVSVIVVIGTHYFNPFLKRSLFKELSAYMSSILT